jgi:hypothetical protein
VQLDASEGLSAVCATADVFFGDSQVPPSKVRIATSAGPGASEALIRIRTTSVVDEPVVTLYVQEGCQHKNTRKYVMLAEALADNTVPVLSTPAPVVVQCRSYRWSRCARHRCGGACRGRAVRRPGTSQRSQSVKSEAASRFNSADAIPREVPRQAPLAPVSPVRQARKPVPEARLHRVHASNWIRLTFP